MASLISRLRIPRIGRGRWNSAVSGNLSFDATEKYMQRNFRPSEFRWKKPTEFYRPGSIPSDA